MMPAEVRDKWAEHKELSLRSLKKRLDTNIDRPDFVEKMLHARGSKGGVCQTRSHNPRNNMYTEPDPPC